MSMIHVTYQPWWLGLLERVSNSCRHSLAIGGWNPTWVYAWYWSLTMLTRYMYPLALDVCYKDE